MHERIRALTKRRVVREGAWVAAGQVLSAAALLGGTRLITEMVDPAEMGAANLLLGIVMLARNVTCAPILQAQYRFYPEFAARGQVGRLRRIATRVLTPVVAILVGATLLAGAVHCYRTGASFYMYVALAGLLVVEAGRTMENNFFMAARRQKPMSAINVGEAIARPAMVALMVYLLGATPQAILLGYMVGSGGVYAAALLVIRREGVGGDAPADPAAAPPPPLTRDPVVRDIWRYAVPLVPLAFIGWVTSVSDRYILGGLLGTKQVGIYTTTYGLMSQPFFLVLGIIGRTMSPIYNRALADGDERLARRSFATWLWGTLAICTGGFLAILLLRGWIARFLLAPEFRPGAALMPWIAAGYALYSAGNVFEARLYARKLTNRVLVGNAIVAAASVVVPVAFLYKWGVLGVAAACPVYFGIMVVVMWRLSRAPRGGEGRA